MESVEVLMDEGWKMQGEVASVDHGSGGQAYIKFIPFITHAIHACIHSSELTCV